MLPITRSDSLSKANNILTGDNEKTQEKVYPYLSFGYKIENRLAYISDVSNIPDHIWPILEPKKREGGGETRLPLLIMDCLRLRPHTSHNGLEAAIAMTRRVKASRTYLTGFSHDVSHEEYVKLTEIVGGAEYNAESLSANERAGLELLGHGPCQWVRPAHDGLRIFVKPSEEGEAIVTDETYI